MTIKALYPSIAPSLLLDFANVKQLDPRITYTRASEARYYDGKTVAKAEENLWLQSQAFDGGSPWSTDDLSVSANTVAAPDGTITADTLTITAATSPHYITQPINYVSGLPYTFSVFVKKNTLDFFQIGASAGPFGSNVWANFDIATGVLGTVGSAATAAISSVGNGWYRCSITGTATGTGGGSSFLAFIQSATDGRLPSYLGNGTDSVYLWGAQLEQRSSVTAYTPTTTQPITNYIPTLLTAQANVARFQHNPITGESEGFWVEEQRANLLTYSEQFDNAVWTKTRSSIASNTIVAPDGTLTGDILVENTDNNSHSFLRDLTLTANTAYTFSAYFKSSNRNVFIETRFAGNWSAYVGTIFNLSTGTVTSGTGTITPVGNGWYRCSITATFGASTTTGGFSVYTVSGTSTSYTGDGYSGIYIWGAQLEAGAFPTSYIPTVASQVTRSADSASMTGTNFSSWWNQNESTMYIEAVSVDTSLAKVALSISDGTFNNSMYLAFPENTDALVWVTVNGGASQTSMGTAGATFVGGTFYKTAFAMKRNDFAASFSGATAQTDTSGTPPIVDRTYIGSSWSGGGNFLNGTIKKLAFYPKRLTNTELQALTGV